MKELLTALCLLGSLSAFACETVENIDCLTYKSQLESCYELDQDMAKSRYNNYSFRYSNDCKKF